MIEGVSKYKESKKQTLTVKFKSYDSPPLIGIKNLAKVFPDVEFVLNYYHYGESKTTVKIDEHWGDYIVTRAEILKECVGNCLSRPVPDNWDEWSEKRQEKFIARNLWEPLENVDGSDVSQMLWEIAESITQLMINNGIPVMDESENY